MRDQLSRDRSIAGHVIDGTITVDSVPELEKMLLVFPYHPALHTAYADLLARDNSLKAAATAYGRAADLFIQNRRMLPAILAKIMQWRIEKPSHEKAREFFDCLHRADFTPCPLTIFFRKLSYAEFIALTNRMVRVRLPSGFMVKKIGEIEDALYFVAAGFLCDTIYQPLQRGENKENKVTLYLIENDILGDVHPLGSERISQSFTKTVSGTELVRISKSRLVEMCAKYPNMARALVQLSEEGRKRLKAEMDRGIRKGGRRLLPIKLHLEIYLDDNDGTPLVLHGYSRDISVGGVCVIVDSNDVDMPKALSALPKSGIQVCFPGDGVSLNVAGDIVWSREVFYEGRKTVALGIQFKEMTPKMSGMLMVFADMFYR